MTTSRLLSPKEKEGNGLYLVLPKVGPQGPYPRPRAMARVLPRHEGVQEMVQRID